MKFVTDKEQIRARLIIFRRGDVGHDHYYCRVRIQNEDRYKTISLKTSDRQTARDRAMDQDADIRFRVSSLAKSTAWAEPAKVPAMQSIVGKQAEGFSSGRIARRPYDQDCRPCGRQRSGETRQGSGGSQRGAG